MNLIVFDIDGTLTHSEMDTKCFAQAIEDVLQVNNLDTDWSSYRYSTESGILKEIYELLTDRIPTEQEITSIQKLFVTYLNNTLSENPSLIVPIPGANTIFQKIYKLSNWHIGIATGGWKISALFKLDSANIPHSTIPKAYSDDHIERAEIIKTAIRHAQSHNKITQYQKIFYVGDRPWDEHAAMQLGIDFIGVGDFIKQKSQHFCVDNYNDSDSDSFLTHLEKSTRDHTI